MPPPHHSGDHFPPPCPHLAAYRSATSNPFGALIATLHSRPPSGIEIGRVANEIPRCALCPPPLSPITPRLYACLACAAVSCPLHPHTLPNHEIAVDVDRAELYCSACRDQVYDPDLDEAVARLQILFHPRESPSANLRKRRRVDYYSSAPHRTPPVLGDGDPHPRGLRGLINVGNTCYMNSVLQALLHTVPMRDYFLTDQHKRLRCLRKREEQLLSAEKGEQKSEKEEEEEEEVEEKDKDKEKEEEEDKSGQCLVCDLDAVYSAVFSVGGDRLAYSPARLLYGWWQFASHLANYEQKDAHEFFISLMNGIHESVVEGKKKRHKQGFGDCCIAHKVFSGILRSDVTCLACGFTSTTNDPCLDISLDLDCRQVVMEAILSETQVCDDEMKPLLSSQSFPSFVGCLERFTRPEKLGSDQMLDCQQCEVKQECLRQMSIGKLPLVICFHIKRSEHFHIAMPPRKVDSYLQFPFSLDMSPYLSSSIVMSRFGNRISAFSAYDSDASTKLAAKFELFAVITHSGTLEAGHYTTYLRLNNQWYKCDDAWITQVSENIVRASQAYMLFYVKKMLCYEANENMVSL